jgi:hypothetical protein
MICALCSKILTGRIFPATRIHIHTSEYGSMIATVSPTWTSILVTALPPLVVGALTYAE